jgi:hypothetical protein
VRVNVGCTLMLMKNIDQMIVLCNETSLTIDELCKHFIGVFVITCISASDKIIIPRTNLINSNDFGLPFNFTWRQFSLTMYFATTINKSQTGLCRMSSYM